VEPALNMIVTGAGRAGGDAPRDAVLDEVVDDDVVAAASRSRTGRRGGRLRASACAT
jgi:hypothetical protein